MTRTDPPNPFTGSCLLDKTGSADVRECLIVCRFGGGTIQTAEFQVVAPPNAPNISLNNVTFDRVEDGTIFVKVECVSDDDQPISDGYRCQYQIAWKPPG